jgi:hypothetical protein
VRSRPLAARRFVRFRIRPCFDGSDFPKLTDLTCGRALNSFNVLELTGCMRMCA